MKLDRSLLPTIDWLRWLIAPALIFIVACLDRGYQTDFWHHLARGREIVARGQIINHDLFTFTIAGQNIRDANWLTQVVYYRLFTMGGLSLVQIANAAILALTLLLIVRLCFQLSSTLQAAAAVGVMVFIGLWPLLLIRPQNVSFLLFVLLYWTLGRIHTSRALVVIPPIIMALWANVHGGFAIGLVLIGAFAVAHLIQGPRLVALGYLLALLLGAVATLVNPYGWTIYQYVGGVTQRASSRGIEEWLAPSVFSGIGLTLIASMGALLILWWVAGRRPRVLDVCLIVCFLPLAWRSTRMVAWWYLAVAPMMAELLAQAWFREPSGTGVSPVILKNTRAGRPCHDIRAAVLCCVLILICALSLPWIQRFNPLYGSVRSTHRTEDDLQALSAFPDGRLFTRLEWGEYFDWSIGPKNALFMDGRIEAYPDTLWRDYCTITGGLSDWQQALDRYQVSCLVLDASYHSRLLPLVRQSGAWWEVAQSGDAILFVRRPDGPILSVVSH